MYENEFMARGRDLEKKKNQKKSYEDIISEGDLSQILKIWKTNPAYKDIHPIYKAFRAGFLCFLFFFSTLSVFLWTENLITAFFFAMGFLLLFIAVFHDSFFSLRYLVSFFKGFGKVDLLQDFHFFQLKEEKDSLFIYNHKEPMSLNVRILHASVLPENVHAAYKVFIRTLNVLKTGFSFQIVQKPLISEQLSKDIKKGSIESQKVEIYFAVYTSQAGTLTKGHLKHLKSTTKKRANDLKSSFNANFRHYKIAEVRGLSLINAFRTFLIKKDVSNLYEQGESKPIGEFVHYFTINTLMKVIFLIFFNILMGFLLSLFPVNIVLILFFLNLILILTFGREYTHLLNELKLRRNQELERIHPFEGMEFYLSNRTPNSLFIHIHNRYLINTQLFNLHCAYFPPLTMQDRYFRSIMGHNLYNTYTLMSQPLDAYEFRQMGYKYLNWQEKETYRDLENQKEAEDWLSFRGGVWSAMLILSVFDLRLATRITDNIVKELGESVAEKGEILKEAYEMNHPNFKLEECGGHRMLKAMQCILFKNKIYSLTRTHLNYVLLQGNTLQQISKISDELKKGLEVKIAAEFNTPLQLENSIVVGKAFNCENLTYETPAGFTLDQLKNLLIVNGTPQSKQLLVEKIVLELIRTNQSAIVFDFEGNYSRIIKMLEGSQFEDKVLHFQLGRTFRVDLLTSDIPYDKNNTDYLKYMLDAYALAYKKSERNIESFKNTLRNNANFDAETMSLILDPDKNRNVWDKDYENVEILTFIKEFAENSISVSSGDKIVGEIRPIDFLQSDKTIIADLSTLVELDHKVFITFVILSKLVHFLREGNNFLPKYLIVPKVDLFFEANYLDRTVHYGKVDKFLNPLLEHEMGLIFLANHVRYLHSNVFNFFSNYVAFRTFDKRDIASLMNIMNLQELHGSGYYGSARNNTYQVDFLRNMTKRESIVKRSDIYQPYPMIIENPLEDLEKMSKEEIFAYMKCQGYDLKNAEKKLLESTKETLLEKDMGDFYALRKEIVRYLDALGTLDSVGNLYKRKVKEELLKAIYPRLSMRTKDRHTIKRIRDDLFELLLTQGYLVEKHPKRASGSEALIPSYGVGPQFELALRDYFETKKVQMDAQVIQEEGKQNEGTILL